MQIRTIKRTKCPVQRSESDYLTGTNRIATISSNEYHTATRNPAENAHGCRTHRWRLASTCRWENSNSSREYHLPSFLAARRPHATFDSQARAFAGLSVVLGSRIH